MLKSNRDKSNFIVTLVLWWYQSNKSVVKLVSLFVFSDPHLFRFSGFTKIILHCCSLRWLKGERSRKVRNSRNVHLGLRSERSNHRSWCVASARLCGTGVPGWEPSTLEWEASNDQGMPPSSLSSLPPWSTSTLLPMASILGLVLWNNP